MLRSLIAAALLCALPGAAAAQFVNADVALKKSLRANKPVLVVVHAKLMEGPPTLREKDVWKAMNSFPELAELKGKYILAVADIALRKRGYDQGLVKKYGRSGISVFAPGGGRRHFNKHVEPKGRDYDPEDLKGALLEADKAYSGWAKRYEELLEKYEVKSLKDRNLAKNFDALKAITGHLNEARVGHKDVLRLYEYMIRLKKKDVEQIEYLSLKMGDAARRAGDYRTASKKYAWCAHTFPQSKNSPKAKMKSIEAIADSGDLKAAVELCEQTLADQRWEKIHGEVKGRMDQWEEERKQK